MQSNSTQHLTALRAAGERQETLGMRVFQQAWLALLLPAHYRQPMLRVGFVVLLASLGVGGSSCGPAHPNPTTTTIRPWQAPANPPPRALPAGRSSRTRTTSPHPGPTTNSCSQPDTQPPHAPHHSASPGGALAFDTSGASWV